MTCSKKTEEKKAGRALEESRTFETGQHPIARRARPETVGIGPFEAWPKDDDLEKQTLGTLIALTVAPSASDEPIAGGIDQLADDLCVLALAIDGKGDMAITDTMTFSSLHAISTRARVLAAVVRRTLAGVDIRGENTR